MSRLTVKLPETLHQQLVNLAQKEGISLNQYIVYALTRQVSIAYTVTSLSENDITQQKQSFFHLIQELGEIDDKSIDVILSQREKVTSDDELSQEIFDQLSHKISQKKSTK
ncbi:toxin-antitoxin system HicB family antitoxin [Aphanothece sacrum]|uniref:CopG family transcriptional regulator n=1 Tax=Aphanothece sacrum FPU1 TaxID=1920663 RepID=A0A401INJ5_APHSA|nr:toxin-antitoxin system HicB family antitoxin [Aphanothece sacrum]GBF82825.1 CopG family transcriptional regulator [Aphanothece sacrum FPU1]GBF85940.1 CopG family transcriptional regulator [Aphanothece sacrum FPU3]